MKFGVREICNVVFKAKAPTRIGNRTFKAGQPVLYIDTAKTSTLEGASTAVYATGGRGNTRLLTWEGEKTLTFTVEDALLSPVGFAILSGAGLIGGDKKSTGTVHVHTTATAQCINGVITLSALQSDEQICTDAPIYVLEMDGDDFVSEPYEGVGEVTANEDGKTYVNTVTVAELDKENEEDEERITTVFVDCYVKKEAANVSELQIDAENFAGFYYVEASCLFRRNDGIDMPAELTIPKVKIQSNFTFNMAATGDPSTFTFTMDAMPDYTQFNPNRKVLCAIQIVNDAIAGAGDIESVFPC
jgi:hypothetical protein